MLLQQDNNKYSVLQIYVEQVVVLSFCYQNSGCMGVYQGL